MWYTYIQLTITNSWIWLFLFTKKKINKKDQKTQMWRRKGREICFPRNFEARQGISDTFRIHPPVFLRQWANQDTVQSNIARNWKTKVHFTNVKNQNEWGYKHTKGRDFFFCFLFLKRHTKLNSFSQFFFPIFTIKLV